MSKRLCFQVQCDRCGSTENVNVAQLDLEYEDEPTPVWPQGWATVCGDDLCSCCVSELRKFLKGES